MALTRALFRDSIDCTAHTRSKGDAWPRPGCFREQGLDRKGLKIRKLHKRLCPQTLRSVVRGRRVYVYKNLPSHLPSHAARSSGSTRPCTGWCKGWQAFFSPQSQLQSLFEQNWSGDHWALSQNKDFACSEVLFLNDGYWSGCWPWEKKSKYNLQLRVIYKDFALRLIPTIMVMQLDTLQ